MSAFFFVLTQFFGTHFGVYQSQQRFDFLREEWCSQSIAQTIPECMPLFFVRGGFSLDVWPVCEDFRKIANMYFFILKMGSYHAKLCFVSPH